MVVITSGSSAINSTGHDCQSKAVITCNNTSQTKTSTTSIKRIMDLCQEMQEPRYCVRLEPSRSPSTKNLGRDGLNEMRGLLDIVSV